MSPLALLSLGSLAVDWECQSIHPLWLFQELKEKAFPKASDTLNSITYMPIIIINN